MLYDQRRNQWIHVDQPSNEEVISSVPFTLPGVKWKSEETEENIKVLCIAKENGWFQNFWTGPLEAKFSLNYNSLHLWYSANKTTWQSPDPSCCLKCPKKRNMTLYLLVSFQWVYFKVLKIGDNMIRIPNSFR